MQLDEGSPETSNITSDVIVEALATYTSDKGQHDRTGMQIARNQAKYARLGVSAEIIRLMYKESKLTGDERQTKYADELRYRRAVSLWDADSEDDFASAMEAASQTEAAHGQANELLVSARCFNDGFNSAAHGRLGPDANPHEAGTLHHAQWAKGCKEGQRHLTEFGEEPANGEVKRGRGRPRKVAVSEHPLEHEVDPSAVPPGNAFGFPDFPDMPH